MLHRPHKPPISAEGSWGCGDSLGHGALKVISLPHPASCAPQRLHGLRPWVQALAEAIKAQTNELHTSVTSMKEMLQNIDRSSRQVSSPTHCEVCAQSAAVSILGCKLGSWTWHSSLEGSPVL